MVIWWLLNDICLIYSMVLNFGYDFMSIMSMKDMLMLVDDSAQFEYMWNMKFVWCYFMKSNCMIWKYTLQGLIWYIMRPIWMKNEKDMSHGSRYKICQWIVTELNLWLLWTTMLCVYVHKSRKLTEWYIGESTIDSWWFEGKKIFVWFLAHFWKILRSEAPRVPDLGTW